MIFYLYLKNNIKANPNSNKNLKPKQFKLIKISQVIWMILIQKNLSFIEKFSRSFFDRRFISKIQRI